jgi:hypothetical protein
MESTPKQIITNENILVVSLNQKMEQVRRCIVVNPSRKRTIQCRNSYERMIVHKVAEALNISHITQTRYDHFYINKTLTKRNYYYGCDKYKLTAVPQTWVLLNQEDVKTVVLHPNGLSLPLPEEGYGNDYDLYEGMKDCKKFMKQNHAKINKLHEEIRLVIKTQNKKMSLFQKPTFGFTDIEIITNHQLESEHSQ